jgi:hypothetical protein
VYIGVSVLKEKATYKAIFIPVIILVQIAKTDKIIKELLKLF